MNLLLFRSRLLGLACIAAAAMALALCGCTSPPPTAPSTTEPPPSAGGDWGFLKFAEVRAYRMNWGEEDSMDGFVDGDGKLNPTRRPKEGMRLDASQVTRLRQAVTGDHPEPKTVSGEKPPVIFCFYPHHAFAFYDERGQRVGYIEVCFLCGGHHGSTRSFADPADLKAVAYLLKDLGIPLSNPRWD